MHANLRRYSMPSAGIYDRVTGFLFRGRYDAIAREIAAEAPPHAAVLDVGCGPAEILIRLARLSPTLRLTGVDVDAPMIERARRKAARAGVTPTFAVADVASLPFEDASFDLVVSSFSMHHWPDPQGGMTEVMRVLKPGGRAIVWDIATPVKRTDDLPAGAHTAELHASEAKAARGEAAEPHAATAYAIGAPQMSGPGWLVALRMLLQFRRLTPHRFEFAKP